MSRGSLFVISGPSGVGKGTLVARLMERIPHSWVSISATTRKPRGSEVDGTEYYFLSDEEFDQLVATDGFLEWANVHADRYGTPRGPVEQHLKAGEHVFLEIDVQGGLQVRQNAPDVHLVFIAPPSFEELRRRLEGRGTEAPDVVDARMKVAEVEMSQKMKYDFVLVNDNIERAEDELVAYIESCARADEREEA